MIWSTDVYLFVGEKPMTSRSRLLLLLLAIGSLAASLTMLAQPAVRFSTYEPNLCSIGADGAGNIYAACINFTTKTSSLVRFASSGSSYTYTVPLTYGGTTPALAVDSAGNAYVTGTTATVNADLYVMKVSPLGQVLMSTTFGGSAGDSQHAIAADPSGNIWVAGSTS